MNGIKRLTNKGAWVLCTLLGGVLVWMLTGCTTYRDHPRARGGYYEAQPSPGVAYVPPSPEESLYVGIRAESDFYEPLSPYGRWEVVGSYGRCWIPGRVDPDWRPYSNGYWQRTDAGWYWASDEPWGWATYHYGRWDLSAQFGWDWVPQTQWAPAWVSWHQGGGYVGWAPLHPSSRFGRSGAVEVNVTVISPRAYVFVEERQFLQPVRPTTVIVNNTTIINKTVNITNIKVVNKTVINEGPRTEVIEQVSGHKVQAVPVRELRRKQEAEVVAKQRITPAVREKNVPPPVRSEVEPREKKVSLTREPPAVTTNESQPPTTKKEAHQADDQRRVIQLEEQRVQQKKVREMESEKTQPTPASSTVKPEAERRVVIEGQKEQEVVEKRAEKAAQKDQKVLDRRAKHEQATTDEGGTNIVKKVHQKKGEKQTPPEDPAVSPQSSQ